MVRQNQYYDMKQPQQVLTFPSNVLLAQARREIHYWASTMQSEKAAQRLAACIDMQLWAHLRAGCRWEGLQIERSCKEQVRDDGKTIDFVNHFSVSSIEL
jgi:hypothetical protein